MSTISTDFQADEFLLDHYVGKTPLVRLQRLASHTQATVLAKLEGNNPAGSVKDRPAYNMIMQAEKRGQIQPGDTLIEATSGNTGIALAMVAAMRGYQIKLIMPNNMSQERKDAMRAYGAELIEVTKEQGMEGARDLALQMQEEGKGHVLNQFGNPDNVEAHYLTTGPELWQQTGGKITHFVSSMGTTGTIMGVSKYLKEMNPDIQIIGLQPSDGSSIAGIRRWPEEYLPTIFDRSRIDQIIDIPQIEAERTMRKLAQKEGISAGTSSGGAVWASIKIAEENPVLSLRALFVTVVTVIYRRVFSLWLILNKTKNRVLDMRLPVLTFDIETMTDLRSGAHLYGLDLPEADLEAALTKLRRQESGMDFQRLALHEIVCISGLWLDDQGQMKLFSFSREQYSEAEILSKFLSIFDKRLPTLVSWNGAQFDLPVIMLRAMYHGLTAPALFDQGEIDTQKRYNNYQNRYHQRHIDLMDVMAMFNGRHFQKLDDVAHLLGYPGKRGDGAYHVPEYVRAQEWLKLTSYCEGDVLNTWLVYLRWLLLKGQLLAQDHRHFIHQTIQFLQAQPQHQDFLSVWRETSQQTAFTAADFSPSHL